MRQVASFAGGGTFQLHHENPCGREERQRVALLERLQNRLHGFQWKGILLVNLEAVKVLVLYLVKYGNTQELDPFGRSSLTHCIAARFLSICVLCKILEAMLVPLCLSS